MSEISSTEEETRTSKDETEDSSDTTSQIEAPSALRFVSPIARVKQLLTPRISTSKPLKGISCELISDLGTNQKKAPTVRPVEKAVKMLPTSPSATPSST